MFVLDVSLLAVLILPLPQKKKNVKISKLRLPDVNSPVGWKDPSQNVTEQAIKDRWWLIYMSKCQ